MSTGQTHIKAEDVLTLQSYSTGLGGGGRLPPDRPLWQSCWAQRRTEHAPTAAASLRCKLNPGGGGCAQPPAPRPPSPTPTPSPLISSAGGERHTHTQTQYLHAKVARFQSFMYLVHPHPHTLTPYVPRRERPSLMLALQEHQLTSDQLLTLTAVSLCSDTLTLLASTRLLTLLA